PHRPAPRPPGGTSPAGPGRAQGGPPATARRHVRPPTARRTRSPADARAGPARTGTGGRGRPASTRSAPPGRTPPPRGPAPPCAPPPPGTGSQRALQALQAHRVGLLLRLVVRRLLSARLGRPPGQRAGDLRDGIHLHLPLAHLHDLSHLGRRQPVPQ